MLKLAFERARVSPHSSATGVQKYRSPREGITATHGGLSAPAVVALCFDAPLRQLRTLVCGALQRPYPRRTSSTQVLCDHRATVASGDLATREPASNCRLAYPSATSRGRAPVHGFSSVNAHSRCAIADIAPIGKTPRRCRVYGVGAQAALASLNTIGSTAARLGRCRRIGMSLPRKSASATLPTSRRVAPRPCVHIAIRSTS